MTFDDFNLEKCADGLLPVIVQDATTLKVLMLGYMNREAYDKTANEGRVTFFSRTRNTLWTKGETSGHYLLVKDIADVLTKGRADAALAASIFHFGEITVENLKKELKQLNIDVRL